MTQSTPWTPRSDGSAAFTTAINILHRDVTVHDLYLQNIDWFSFRRATMAVTATVSGTRIENDFDCCDRHYAGRIVEQAVRGASAGSSRGPSGLVEL